jgi:hypothetical protein
MTTIPRHCLVNFAYYKQKDLTVNGMDGFLLRNELGRKQHLRDNIDWYYSSICVMNRPEMLSIFLVAFKGEGVSCNKLAICIIFLYIVKNIDK